jgi:hypothetical protein
MGCACINVNSKLVIKANSYIPIKNNLKKKDNKENNTKYDIINKHTRQITNNKNNNITPILWLTIVDFLEYKDLKETRKINR